MGVTAGAARAGGVLRAAGSLPHKSGHVFRVSCKDGPIQGFAASAAVALAPGPAAGKTMMAAAVRRGHVVQRPVSR